ncbi:hypothetical protein KP509_06G046400 [Ceratopteris richardii]|uniref:3-hydroxyisobutyrate dehydrogenase n=1 Tax=Ceratopteris richardii TaxID=49495 RepID=A0A8T2UKG9_CERRI|nr:hypothetical protein KP509_06G046400 [Ceratopteris richardii]KAH7435040.1 hypothetical protein KP509_06G046400 [Ceratopteris richardii]
MPLRALAPCYRLLQAAATTGRHFSSATSAFQWIGFIGLGNMGSHMANNLIKAGYRLVVHDINDATVQMFSEKGAIAAKSPLEVSELAEVVITMLPSAKAVSDVYMGKNGLLSKRDNLRPFLLIDASTVDPKTSCTISTFSRQCSLAEGRFEGFDHPIVLDSPVSGGVVGAQAGSLTFMVGGIEDGCKAAEPLLSCMGKNILYCGASGTGSAAKICNNLALAVSMAGVSEALSLGQKLGINAHTLTKIFNTSSSRCWSSDTYNPVPGVMKGVPASREYNGGFSCQLMKKDLELAVAAANENNALTPLAVQVKNMYGEMCEGGNGGKDFSSIFKLIYRGSSEEFSVPEEQKF